ncbi:hypothetical protein F8S13_20210 [Chloroflexia bacterium SDU3-3]|nr:hypothetical protein F8S13_20210 [Chloroflexia bacterium SDU3-3]
MKKTVQWLGISIVAIAMGASLSACATAPTAHSQSGSVADERPNQGTSLDQTLLKQVDTAIAAAKSRGEDTSAAQTLRDSAVDLASKNLFEEANGNLKTAAALVGVLTTAAGETVPTAVPTPAVPQAPVARATDTVLSAPTFNSNADISAWTLVGPTSREGTPLWEVRDGTLRQRGIDGVVTSDDQTGLVTGDTAWTDYTVSVQALGSDTKELGLIARQQNGENYYRFRARLLGTGTNSGNYILEKVVDGAVTPIASFDGAELSAGVWHTLGLTVVGDTLTATVDGTTLGSATDATFSAGRAGVSSLAMSGAQFAHLQVLGR